MAKIEQDRTALYQEFAEKLLKAKPGKEIREVLDQLGKQNRALVNAEKAAKRPPVLGDGLGQGSSFLGISN